MELSAEIDHLPCSAARPDVPIFHAIAIDAFENASGAHCLAYGLLTPS